MVYVVKEWDRKCKRYCILRIFTTNEKAERFRQVLIADFNLDPTTLEVHMYHID